MIRNFSLFNELLTQGFAKLTARTTKIATLNSIDQVYAVSTQRFFSVKKEPTTVDDTPSITSSIQFATQTVLDGRLSKLFKPFLHQSSSRSMFDNDQLNQLKTEIQRSPLEPSQKQIASSLANDLRLLLKYLQHQSNQQVVTSMRELDDDRPLVRLRLEQILSNRLLTETDEEVREPLSTLQEEFKKKKGTHQCLIISDLLRSRQENNELSNSFVTTLSSQLAHLGVNVISPHVESLPTLTSSSGSGEPPKTLMIIPAKKHFCLSYLENKSDFERIMTFLHRANQDKQTSILPLFLDLSQGTTATFFSYFQELGKLLSCGLKSYSEILKEIIQQCYGLHSPNSDFQKQWITLRSRMTKLTERPSEDIVSRYCAPRFDPLTTDLFFNHQSNFLPDRSHFIKCSPLICRSIPTTFHPQFFDRGWNATPIFDQRQATLSQLYRKIVLNKVDDDGHQTLFTTPIHFSNAYERMSLLGQVALYATLVNRRHFAKNDLEQILTKSQLLEFEALLERWGMIGRYGLLTDHVDSGKKDLCFNYLIVQEYFAAFKLAEIIIEAKKNREQFVYVRENIKELLNDPRHEFLWRLTAGHLIHQEDGLQRFFYLLSTSIEDPLYKQYLLASCLVECEAPSYLSEYITDISQSQKINGSISSWLLKDSKEVLLREPKLWLTVISIHAQMLLEQSNKKQHQFDRFYWTSFGVMRREWPHDQLTLVLEGLANGYPDLMIPLFEKALKDHENSDIRSAIVKAMGHLELNHQYMSSLLINTLYHDPSSWVRSEAVAALGSLCQKHPDCGLHLLQQLALMPEQKIEVREAAVTALGHLHPCLDSHIFPTLKHMIIHDPSNRLKILAINGLNLTNESTKDDTLNILKRVIDDDPAEDVKKAALLKIYPLIKEQPERALSILSDLTTSDCSDSTTDFIVNELTYWIYSHPPLVMEALKTIFSQGRNSYIFYRAAEVAAELAQRYPDEIIALYRELRANLEISSFSGAYLNSILLNMGNHSPELVFPILIECTQQLSDNKHLLWSAIEGIGLFGHVNPKMAFVTLERLLRTNQTAYVIKKIAAALGDLGKRNPMDAMGLLQPLLTHEEADVSLAALHSLLVINHSYPDVTKASLGSREDDIIKQGIVTALERLNKKLGSILFSSERTMDELSINFLGERVEKLLRTSPSVASQIIVELVQSKSDKQKYSTFEDAHIKSIEFLLSMLNQSDPLLAESLISAIRAVDQKYAEHIKKIIESEDRFISPFSRKPLPKIKSSNPLPSAESRRRYLGIFNEKIRKRR
ncbi:MAG: HEAT repeat domain-containing protein [Chlamydiales bacterium]